MTFALYYNSIGRSGKLLEIIFHDEFAPRENAMFYTFSSVSPSPRSRAGRAAPTLCLLTIHLDCRRPTQRMGRIHLVALDPCPLLAVFLPPPHHPSAGVRRRASPTTSRTLASEFPRCVAANSISVVAASPPPPPPRTRYCWPGASSHPRGAAGCWPSPAALAFLSTFFFCLLLLSSSFTPSASTTLRGLGLSQAWPVAPHGPAQLLISRHTKKWNRGIFLGSGYSSKLRPSLSCTNALNKIFSPYFFNTTDNHPSNILFTNLHSEFYFTYKN